MRASVGARHAAPYTMRGWIDFQAPTIKAHLEHCRAEDGGSAKDTIIPQIDHLRWAAVVEGAEDTEPQHPLPVDAALLVALQRELAGDIR